MTPSRFPPAFADADVLVVPGRGGSCERHWQSDFERRHANARRVEQPDWDAPDLDAWARRIAAAALATPRPVLVVAHSFGCLALAHALSAYDADIDAALLVAPAAPGRFGIDAAEIARRLPVPTLLVASDDDPWLTAAQAAELAAAWGSRTLNLGRVGHINVASGFGPWSECDRLAAAVWRDARGESPTPAKSILQPRLERQSA